MEQLLSLWYDSGIYQMAPGQLVMILVGLLLLYLAINRGFEPLLLVPIGFGGILANIPGAGLAFSAVENAINTGDPEVLAALAQSLGLASWETAKDIFHAYEASSAPFSEPCSALFGSASMRSASSPSADGSRTWPRSASTLLPADDTPDRTRSAAEMN